MADKKVIVYSAEWCPWCHKAIDFLKANNVKFEIRDVGADPKFATEVQQLSGQTGIPVIVIDKTVIIGYNIPDIKKALGI